MRSMECIGVALALMVVAPTWAKDRDAGLAGGPIVSPYGRALLSGPQPRPVRRILPPPPRPPSPQWRPPTVHRQRGGAKGLLGHHLNGDGLPRGTYELGGAGTGLAWTPPPRLPAGVPPANMNSRHVLENFRFFKAVKPGVASGNSYLLRPVTPRTLNLLYREAIASGTRDGPVRLSNGQVWAVNRTTGKFFPMSGWGIVQLTQQEVRLLEMLVTQVRSGRATPEAALQNLSRAMGGQRYTVTPDMTRALEVAGPKLGIARGSMTKALAPHLPASYTARDVPDDLRARARSLAGGRAFRLLRYGGRFLLVVGLAVDGYEVFVAENKKKTITKKVGAWATAAATGAATAQLAAPLLAAGPVGWLGYTLAVGGAGAVGYFVGQEVTETIYEWTFE